MSDLKLNSPLQYVKGVGPKKAAALGKLGIQTVSDLLYYFPRTYLDRTNVIPIAKVQVNETATVIGVVRAHGMLFGKRKRYEVMLEDNSGALMLLWFAGIRFFERLFLKGQVYAATGQVGYFQGLQIIHPELERLDDETDKLVHSGRIIPVYPQTAELSKLGLNSRGIRTLTTSIFENLKETIPDALPESERNRYQLLKLDDAVRHIHYPESREQIEECRRRLAFDELLSLQFYVHRNKGKKATLVKNHQYAPPADKLSALKKSLPYELTDAQKKVIKEIIADLRLKKPMTRLLHGDVGCGKTAVAVIAALYAAENKLQTAFMAPTEILAEQHFRNWHDPLAGIGVSLGLLTSSFKASEKKKIAARCESGELQILFGTHALISDYVAFQKLGLVIIDEQHRFGVEQRGQLFAKGDNPDLLIMTATPIPRTLALTMYGDLDISTINALPPGRKPIRTVWRNENTRPKVMQFVADQISKGGQAYIIYPLIEKGEEGNESRNAEDAFTELSAGALKSYRLGLVHGRIKSKKRDETLALFRERKLDALIATTVIEVGVDNPNANMIVIEHAERFGLAQLHQLRGRVGRGETGGTVVALAYQPMSEISRQRLEYFAAHSDGFEIAEADLNMRGPGEVFGLKQSGLPELRLANYARDRDLLEASQELSQRLFVEKETLEKDYKNLFNYLMESAVKRDVNLGGG